MAKKAEKAAGPAKPAKKPVERVGLLFVHGMGEQKRFEHLKSSLREFAELMRTGDADASINVTDRTEGWKPAPGEPDMHSDAPVTMSVVSKAPGKQQNISFECHEVWWGDLGHRDGAIEEVRFWIWGLGQWAAPIYLEPGQPRSLVLLPRSVAGTTSEIGSRLHLMAVGTATALSYVSWTLAKRLFSRALGKAPSTTLVAQYLGDVRTYERRRTAGESNLVDPLHPRRVTIRRRMMTEMVAMSQRGYDRWYIVAHSLGTVLAYNGLTETSHALPNYLPKSQWDALPAELKTDPDCGLRKNTAWMIPSRPNWLKRKDVINRKILFSKLCGVLTYGSPIDKFAGLWPRVVGTANDQKGLSPFADTCTWFNLTARHDPASGWLDGFNNGPVGADHVPKLVNRRTPIDWAVGLSHVRYFKPRERFNSTASSGQKFDVMDWLRDPTRDVRECDGGAAQVLGAIVGYLVVFALLWFGAILLVGLAGGVWNFFAGGKAAEVNVNTLAGWLWTTLKDWALPVLSTTFAVVGSAGVWRWWREAKLNYRLAQHDFDGLKPNDSLYYKARRRAVCLLCAQRCASRVFAPLALVGFAAILWINFTPERTVTPPASTEMNCRCAAPVAAAATPAPALDCACTRKDAAPAKEPSRIAKCAAAAQARLHAWVNAAPSSLARLVPLLAALGIIVLAVLLQMLINAFSKSQAEEPEP